MKSRWCKECSEWWPKHLIQCPLCSSPTQESSKEPMDETEYKWLMATKKGRCPELPKSEKVRFEQEWARLEAEVARRRGHWSLADLIGEGFRTAA